MRRIIRLGGLLGIALAILVGTAQPASAHTNLIATSPADGSVLGQAPAALTFTFSEDVSLDLAEVSVATAAGKPVAIAAPRIGARATELVVALPALEDDAYRITYRVRDPFDLHLTSGSIVFGVGQAALPEGDAATTSVNPVEAVLRWIEWGGIALALGAASVALWHGRAIADSDARRLVIARSLRLISVGVLAAAFAEVAGVVNEVVDIGGSLTETARQVLLSSAYGRRALISLQLAIVVIVLFRMARPLLLRRRGRPSTMIELAPAVLLIGLVIAAAFAGHASTGGSFVTGVALRVAHLLGIGLWAGGLVVVVLLLPRNVPLGRKQLLQSFASTAVAATAITVASGLALSGREVTSVTALLSTSFGGVLIVKVALVAVALALGAHHARHLARPVVERVRTVAVEAGVLVLVLGGGALLASTQPATGARFDPPEAASPLVRTEQVGDLLVRLSLRPNHPGRNSLEVVLLETRRPSLGAVASVEVVLRSATGERTSRRGAPTADGLVVLEPVDIAAPGTMAADIMIDRPASSLPAAHFDWTVDRIPAPRATTKISDEPIAGPLNIAALLSIVLAAGWTWRSIRRRPSAPPMPSPPGPIFAPPAPDVEHEISMELV